MKPATVYCGVDVQVRHPRHFWLLGGGPQSWASTMVRCPGCSGCWQHDSEGEQRSPDADVRFVRR